MSTYVTPETIAAAARTQATIALSLPLKAFFTFERLAALNLNTARVLVEDMSAASRILAEARSVKTVTGLTTSSVKPGLEKLTVYNRSVYEIVSDISRDFGNLLELQMAEANRSVVELLDHVAAASPAGPDLAINAIRTAVTTANSAYENFQSMAKEVGMVADANVEAAAKVTAKTMDAALVALPA